MGTTGGDSVTCRATAITESSETTTVQSETMNGRRHFTTVAITRSSETSSTTKSSKIKTETQETNGSHPFSLYL